MPEESRVRWLGVATALAAALSGCHSAPTEGAGPIVLNVAAAEYGRGDTVRATLINDSRSAYRSTTCRMKIEMAVGQTWVAIPDIAFSPCASSSLPIQVVPGGTQPFVAVLPATIASGEYRLSWFTGSPGDPAALVSSTFRVRD